MRGDAIASKKKEQNVDQDISTKLLIKAQAQMFSGFCGENSAFPHDSRPVAIIFLVAVDIRAFKIGLREIRDFSTMIMGSLDNMSVFLNPGHLI